MGFFSAVAPAGARSSFPRKSLFWLPSQIPFLATIVLTTGGSGQDL